MPHLLVTFFFHLFFEYIYTFLTPKINNASFKKLPLPYNHQRLALSCFFFLIFLLLCVFATIGENLVLERVS